MADDINTKRIDSPNASGAQDTGKKAMGGIGGWFSALLGKPKTTASATETKKEVVSTEKSVETPRPEEPLVVTDFSKEDSVKEDLVKFKTLLSKYKAGVGEKMAPVTSKGVEKMNAAINTSASVADKPFYKKIIKLFFVVFFVLILIYVGATLFNILRRRGVTQVTDDPTPTPIPYEPTKPSVYADDAAVLKLEEDIDVLEKELARIGLRENDLIPPKLDFEVTFK